MMYLAHITPLAAPTTVQACHTTPGCLRTAIPAATLPSRRLRSAARKNICRTSCQAMAYHGKWSSAGINACSVRLRPSDPSPTSSERVIWSPMLEVNWPRFVRLVYSEDNVLICRFLQSQIEDLKRLSLEYEQKEAMRMMSRSASVSSSDVYINEPVPVQQRRQYVAE